MKAITAQKSRIAGIALLALAAAGLTAAIVLNARGSYPLGKLSWIAAAVLGIMLVAGCALTFRESYARMSFSKKTGLWGIIFLLPWLLGFTLFFLVPMLEEFVYSFENVSIRPTGGLNEEFIWFENFRYILLEHATYVRSLTETVLEVMLYTVLIIVFSLLCAILLNGKFFGRSAARAIFFVPIVMATGLMIERVSNTAGLLLAQSQDDKVYGAAIISKLLFSLGVGSGVVSYLANAVNDIFEVVSLSGIQILIFLAALQSIPPQLYEVAKIEGATGYQTFWKVTVVMVSPMLLTCTLYTISDLFLRSDLADTFKDIAFKQGQFGRSAAMSSFFLLAVLLVIGIYVLPLRKAVFYYD
ncbi:MAG: sugar ABC transporter permease [Clostridia bacterium]|nr:sugar ABC transporter permease [Clostridia bacterium]MBR5379346.1 sugar ABC transporter permease [Clostridia bacterium]